MNQIPITDAPPAVPVRHIPCPRCSQKWLDPEALDEEQALAWQGDRVCERSLTLVWSLSVVPQLRLWAQRKCQGQAYVLGSGPSLSAVTPDEWRALRRWTTVAVNFTPEQLPADFTPDLSMAVDGQVSPLSRDRFERMARATRTRGGRVLLGLDGYDLPHDWCAPTYCMAPLWDLDFGLSTSGQRRHYYSRTALAAVHLLAMLGFRNICLVGCDHGADYKATEPARAAHAYGAMASWMESAGARLWQCGAKPGFEAEGLTRKRLGATLEGAWEGTRRQSPAQKPYMG